MFDWLFGTGRQTNNKDATSMYNQVSASDKALNDYYNNNIANGKWDSLSDSQKVGIANTYDNMKSQATAGDQNYKTYLDAYNQENKDNKYNYFGNGVLGAILNPIGQTASAIGDAVSGNYQKNGRDLASDLGAAGESLLTFLPGVGWLGKAGKIGKALTSIPGMAATGAGINALDTVRQEGSDTNLGDVMSSAGTGALFGGAIPLASRVAGNFIRGRGANAITKAATNRGMSDEAINQLVSSVPNRALFTSGLKSFVPRTTFGKVAVGGGALAGGNMLLNNLNNANAQTPDTMGVGTAATTTGTGSQDQMNQLTEQQLYQYLQQMGYM